MKRKKVLAFMAAVVLGMGSMGNVPVFADELEIGETVIDPETGTEGVIVESPGNTDEVLAMMEEALESGTIVTGNAENTVEVLQARAADTAGQWVEISSTKWKWRYPNGIYAVNTWICVSNQYYYIGSDQYMKFGWMLVDGEYYYAGPSGAIYMNCGKELDGKNCHFNPSGHLVDLECWIKPVHQAKSNWCWAANSEMLGTYGTSSNRDQYDIVRFIYGSEINKGGTSAQQAAAIKYASMDLKVAYIGPRPKNDAVKSQLISYQPMKIGIQYKKEDASHAMSIYGFKEENGIDYWKYVDPALDEGASKKTRTVSYLTDNDTFYSYDSVLVKG